MDFGLGLILSFTDNASAGINNAANQLMRLTEMAEQSTNSINQMADLTALSSLSVMSGQLGDTFLSMGGAITGMFQKLLQGTIDTGSQFESLRITVNALTGDAEKGQQAIQKLMNFAATSPFEINDLTGMFTTITANGLDAFATLQGAKTGFEQELLGFIGDIMAFRPDVPAQQWGTAIRNAFSGEVRSLKVALDLNPEDIIGRDWGDTPEQIAQDFADLADNLGIAGLMMKNMGTWSQTLSNVSDQFTRFFLAIADAGVFNDLKEALFGITDALISIDDTQLNTIATVIANSLSIIVKPLVSAGKAIGNFIRWLTKLTTTSPKLAKFIIQVVAVTGALLTFTGVALKLVSSLSGLATVFIAMGGSFTSMRSILVGGIKAIASRVGPLAIAVGGMYLAWKTDFAGMRTLVTGFVQHLGNSFSTARNAINMSVGGMVNVVTDLQNKGGFWNNLTVGLMKLMIVCRALSELWNSEDGFTLSEDTFLKAQELGVLPLIEAILDLKYRFGLFKEGFIAGFKEVSDSIKNFLTGLRTNLEGTFIDTALDKLTQFLELLSSGDADAWYQFGESFGKFTAKATVFFAAFKVLDSIFGKVTRVATAVAGIGKAFGGISKVVGGIGKAVTKLFPTFTKLGGFIKSAFEVMLLPGSFGDKIGAIFPRLPNLFTSIGTKLVPILSQTILPAVTNFFTTTLPSALSGIGSALLSAVSAIFSPIGLAVIAVLAPIITYAVTHWEEFKEKVSGIWTTLKEEGMNIWNSLKDGLSSIWENLKTAVQPVIDAFLNLKDKVVEVAGLIGDNFGTVKDFIVQKAQEIASSPVFQGIISALSTVGSFLVDVLVPLVQGVIQTISSAIQGIWNLIVTVVNTVVNIISSALSGIMNIISGILDIIVGIFTGDLDRIWQGVQTIFSSILNFITAVLQGIWNIISSVFSTIINVISTALNAIWNVVQVIWNAIKSVITTVVSGISSFLSSAWNTIRSTVSSAMNAISSTVSSIWNTIKSTISNVINGIKSIVSTGWNAVKSTITSVGAGIKSAVSSVFESAKSKISSVMDRAKSIVSSAISKISSLFTGANLSLPHIKLPHFSISGSFSLNPPSIPHIGVEWYAKGGVFNKPTMIGVGENGQEAVMPLEKNTGWITTLASKIGSLLNSSNSASNSLINGISGTFSNAITGISASLNNLNFISPEGANKIEPFNPKPEYTNGNYSDFNTPNNYITNTNNQENKTTQGNVDNSVVFQNGAIVVQVSGTTNEDAEKFAELIMEKIERKQKLKKMANYKDVNYKEPEFAY